MREIFKLVGKIAMDGVDYVEKSLASIEKKTDSTAKGMGKFSDGSSRAGAVLKSLPKIFGAAAVSVGAIASAWVLATNASADFADGIDKTAKRMQMSTDTSQKLDYVMRGIGGSVEDLSGGMQKLQKNAADAFNGNKKLANLFENDLHVSLTDVNGNLKDTSQLFEDTIFALTKIENPTLRASLAQDVFGKSAVNLLPLLQMSNAEIKEQIANATKYNQVLSEDSVKSLDEAGDAIDALNRSMKVAKAEVLAGFAPALTTLALKAAEAASGIRRIFNASSDKDIYTERGNYVAAGLTNKIKDAENFLTNLKRGQASAEDIEKQQLKIANLKHQLSVNKGLFNVLANGDTSSATTGKSASSNSVVSDPDEDANKATDEAAAYESKKQDDIDAEVATRMNRITEIRKENTQAVINWETTNEKEKIENQASLDAQWIDEKLENEKDLAKEQLKIDEDLAAARADLDEQEKQEVIDKISYWTAYGSQLSDVFSQIYSNKIESVENAETKEIAAINNSLMSEEDKAAAIDNIEAQSEKKKKALMRKQAILAKATGLLEVGINTAVGIMKAMSLTWPLNLVMAAFTGVMGIAQTAAIASKPIPAAKGLFAPAQSGGVNTLIAEGKQDEIVFPLITGVDLLADLLVNKLLGLKMPSAEYSSGSISDNQLTNNTSSDRGIIMHLHIGNFFGDDASLKQLERKMKTIRVSESQRTGDLAFSF